MGPRGIKLVSAVLIAGLATVVFWDVPAGAPVVADRMDGLMTIVTTSPSGGAQPIYGGHGQADRIRIESFSLYADRPVDPASTTPEKANFRGFFVTKQLDAASPELFFRFARGDFLDSVRVTLLRENGEPLITMRFTEAVVTAIEPGLRGERRVEQITFHYRTVRSTYHSISGSDVTRCWDIAQDSAC